jgi:cytochrome c
MAAITTIGLCIVLLLAGCREGEPEAVEVPGGDPVHGAELIVAYDCGSCHYIPGIEGADGREAPGLQIWPNRSFVAGAAPNHPENVIAFLMEPQSIQPGSAMPDLGISEEEARDITAYLFTIRGPE